MREFLGTFAVFLLIGCGGVQVPSDALAAAVKTANTLADSAEVAEKELSSTCALAEIVVATDPIKLALIQNECHRVYQEYDRFRLDWGKLAVAIQSKNIESVVYMLEQTINDEKAFIEDVQHIVEAIG